MINRSMEVRWEILQIVLKNIVVHHDTISFKIFSSICKSIPDLTFFFQMSTNVYVIICQ